MSRLEFRGGRWHTYYLDGRRIPGATTVIGRALAKDGLTPKAAQLTAEWAARSTGLLGDVLTEPQWVKAATAHYRDTWDQARDDGTNLHYLAQPMVYGEPMPDETEDGEPVTEQVRAMAGQLARFLDAFDVQPVGTPETLVYSETHHYAGTWDLCADFDGARWLLDYKTSASGIWPETSLQLSAYGFATHYVDADDEDHEIASLGIERAAGVVIRPDYWELRPVRFDLPTHGVFLSMLPIYEWARQRREQSVFEPVPAPVASS